MMDKSPINNTDNSLVKTDNTNKTEKPNAEIKSLIYYIRGQQVMLDSDLAKLYQCKNGAKAINQAVKRNPERFPEDFCFQLSKEELANLRSQNVTASNRNKSRTSPFVFTEQGVSMLATTLKTDIAAQVSIKIIREFIAIRKYIANNLLEQQHIYNLVLEDHETIRKNSSDIKQIQQALDQFTTKQKDDGIYFNGQIYHAYSRILKIFSEAKQSLTIIDAYTDIITLNIIKRLTIPVTIITSKSAPIKSEDIKKYQEQYDNLIIIYDSTFHDRYFILDGKTVYHCGASINRIGYKTFSITKINDEEIVAALLSKIASK